jgi:hypothetical protein
MTYDDLLKKEALLGGFSQGFLNEIKKTFDFSKPFEMAFRIFGPMLAFKMNWMVGAFVTAAEVLGFGPGEIGKLIDEYFASKGASNANEMELTKGTAGEAANHVANKISDDFTFENVINKIKSKYAANLNDLKEIKGTITEKDLWNF